MRVRLVNTFLVLALMPAFVMACDNAPSEAPGAGGSDGAGEAVSEGNAPAPADEGAGVAPGAEGAADEGGADTAGDELGVGVISSGTADVPLAEPTPEAPEIASRSRRVNESELPGLVRFTLFEPTFLPEESYTVAPIITEPESGDTAEGLPSVATGYTVADRDSFAFVMSPAGEGPMPVGDGEAEQITVGGIPATLYENSQGKLTIVWERGDTRLEIRSAGLARDVVLQIAEGLAPVE